MVKPIERYKMKKVIYFFVSFLILSNNLSMPVAAGDSQASAHSFFGQGRIGCGLAVEYLTLEAKQKDNYLPFGSNLHGDRMQTRKHIQIAPSIELGAIILNDYYLALFASWRHVGAKTKSRAPLKGLTHLYHEFKINHYVDILAKPGYKLTPKTMIYGLIGPSIANWTHTTDQFNRVTIDDPEVLKDRFKISNTSTGLGLGLGLEYIVQDQYAFSIDYIYHLHKAVSKEKNMTLMDNIGGPVARNGNVSKKVMPSYTTIAVRLTTSLRLW